MMIITHFSHFNPLIFSCSYIPLNSKEDPLRSHRRIKRVKDVVMWLPFLSIKESNKSFIPHFCLLLLRRNLKIDINDDVPDIKGPNLTKSNTKVVSKWMQKTHYRRLPASTTSSFMIFLMNKTVKQPEFVVKQFVQQVLLALSTRETDCWRRR